MAGAKEAVDAALGGKIVEAIPTKIGDISAAEIASQRRVYLNDKFSRTGDVNADITIRGRQEIAEKAFLEHGINASDIRSYMTGIDFANPVWLEQMSPGKRLYQYQTPGAPQGNFYTISETVQPSELWISPFGLNRATNTIELKVIHEYA